MALDRGCCLVARSRSHPLHSIIMSTPTPTPPTTTSSKPISHITRQGKALWNRARQGRHDLIARSVLYGAPIDWQGSRGTTPLHIAIETSRKHPDEAMATVVSLLELKANVSSVNHMGQTPLFTACSVGNHAIMMLLLRHTGIFDVERTAVQCETLMHAAARGGNLEVVRELLQHGASVNATTATGHTPLLIACAGSHTEIARSLLEHRADVNASAATVTPVFQVLVDATDNVELMSILLDHGADLNLHNRSLTWHFSFACRASPKIARVLLDRGADIHGASNYSPPIVVAPMSGDIELIDVLLERKADLHTESKVGPYWGTPLAMAAAAGKPLAVSHLLALGARLHSTVPPLAYAISTQHYEQYPNVSRFNSKEEDLCQAISMLIEARSDVNGLSLERTPLLYRAAGYLPTRVIEILLDAKANVDATGNWDRTPLYEAAYWDRIETVKLLLARRANPNHLSHDGQSPLHFAVTRGSLRGAKLLIDAHADVNACARQSRLGPIHQALSSDRPELVELLLSRKASPNLIGPTGPPLHSACSERAVMLLLNYRADIDARSSSSGDTALHSAALYGRVAVFQALIAAGADPLIVNVRIDASTDGCTA